MFLFKEQGRGGGGMCCVGLVARCTHSKSNNGDGIARVHVKMHVKVYWKRRAINTTRKGVRKAIPKESITPVKKVLDIGRQWADRQINFFEGVCIYIYV